MRKVETDLSNESRSRDDERKASVAVTKESGSVWEG